MDKAYRLDANDIANAIAYYLNTHEGTNFKPEDVVLRHRASHQDGIYFEGEKFTAEVSKI